MLVISIEQLVQSSNIIIMINHSSHQHHHGQHLYHNIRDTMMATSSTLSASTSRPAQCGGRQNWQVGVD